jgi:hypothetical protein
VPDDDDVLDLENVDRELHDRKAIEVVWTTMFARLRCTKMSPGSSPTIWLAGTRLSAHPITQIGGDCCAKVWRKIPGPDVDSFGPFPVVLEQISSTHVGATLNVGVSFGKKGAFLHFLRKNLESGVPVERSSDGAPHV